MRKSRKGIPIDNTFKQLFCSFTDGTSFHLTHFDDLLRDAGYIETIENSVRAMMSSQCKEVLQIIFSCKIMEVQNTSSRPFHMEIRERVA